MRPLAIEFFARWGLPAWLVPDYFTLVGIAGLVAATIALSLARRDGADVPRAARGLAVAYVAALAGGYVFEWLRALPIAIVTGSLAPFLHVGRAAYGGVLFGSLATIAYLRWCGEPVAPFFDRVSPGGALAFTFVRTGCFLAGCDYGRPTAGPLGVRFPPGSLAAMDHYQRGFIRGDAPSLPVHPTELYEAAVGLMACAAALAMLRTRRRDGSAFAAFLAIYATGRFALEFLRGDLGRGALLGLSTAQVVSVGLWVVLAAWWARRRGAARVSTT